MPPPKRSPIWQALAAHHRAARGSHLRDLLADAKRTRALTFSRDGLHLDLSKNRMTAETVDLLLALAREREVEDRRRALFAGEAVNETEGRAALHMALRAQAKDGFKTQGTAVGRAVADTLARMATLTREIGTGQRRGATGKRFTDVVNIGIGGSDLGPRMVCGALGPARHLTPHFVANVDAADIQDVLARLDPATTLFVVSSKTFTTQETLANAETAKRWLTPALGKRAVAAHFVAVTRNIDGATGFGLADDNLFPIWDWVGGRYSVWSAIGLPVALAYGMPAFRALLKGARAMDRHFLDTPLEKNLPVLLAMAGIWNRNFEGIAGHAVLPYDQRLDDLPIYLQQLEMESNGKSIDRNGQPVAQATAPVIFGQAGTIGQHAFYQLLHQGTDKISSDFIAAAQGPDGPGTAKDGGGHRDKLLANFLAQPAALALGRDAGPGVPPHKTFPGNRPSTTILLDRLDPYHLGMLLALYEHKVFVQGVIWNVNSFDQFGVELGKELATPLVGALAGGTAPRGLDPSTKALLTRVRKLRGGKKPGAKR